MRDDEYFEILTNFKGASHYSSVLKKYHFDEKQFLHEPFELTSRFHFVRMRCGIC